MNGLKISGREKALKGSLTIPGDKSISHRSIILLSISEGISSVENLLYSEDVVRTLDIFESMGVEYKRDNDKLIIKGVGLYGLKESKKELYCGNSGTTMRLLSGLLVGQDFDSVLVGDHSLMKRPMERIINPLRELGGNIESSNGRPPIKIKAKKNIAGINYNMEIASAQVKSAILLAGLYSESSIKIKENGISRNHTENMLKYLGADLDISNGMITLKNKTSNILQARDIFVPGDISSAAYFIVAASILENSEVILKKVGINSTRDGIIEVLKEMGADIELLNINYINNEKIADIKVASSELKGVTISSDKIGRLIDEIPIIAVAAAFAKGKTLIRNVGELRVKETDRLSATIKELSKAGVAIWEEDDNLLIEGGEIYSANIFETYNDHRMAMALSIFALKCKGESEILNSQCIDISYPDFYKDLSVLSN